jgi:hypothetical protein
MKCRRIWGEADTAIGKIVLDEINGRASVPMTRTRRGSRQWREEARTIANWI